MADVETTTSEAPVVAAPAVSAPAKKKQKRSVPAGQLHIQATFNNTIVSFTDKKGNVLTQASAGAAGFRGSKRELHTHPRLPQKKQLRLQRRSLA